MINAFHSNWTAPFFSLSERKKYSIEDFEILTTILSALKWRQFNGSIKMITDRIAAQYYLDIGITSIWDLGMDIEFDNESMKDIDEFLFWAAGKIYALKSQSTPCAMIDTDFIVWQSLENKLIKSKICTIHRENIYEDIYPYKSHFDLKEGYEFDSDWSWSVLPCNTAFTYISDEEFKNYYVNESIRFMKNVLSGKDRITNMVFAEQRLISMCADKMDIKIDSLSDLKTLASNDQNYFTHIWGYKDVMRNEFVKRNEFCIKCIKRIVEDFPEYESMVSNIEPVYNYYIQYKRAL